MRKKSTKKSEEKTHKHSRRRRKSSSSAESENESSEVQSAEVTDNSIEEPKTRRGRKSADAAVAEVENNTAPAGGRVTRHSRRLAAISGTSDEMKEIIPEVLSPAKTGKSSPYSGGSPVKDTRQKKDGTPDKHKAPKDTWMVESANGSGVQKLKIRLQRFPEASPNEEGQNEHEVQDVAVSETEAQNADDEVEEVVVSISEVSQNDVADIQLPASKSSEIEADLPASTETQFDSIAQATDEIENIELPPEPQPVIEDVEMRETEVSESQQMQECVSEISLPDEKVPEEIPLPNETSDVDKIASDKRNEISEPELITEEKEEKVDEDPVMESAEQKITSSEIVSSPQQALSEQEDKDYQTELVLTVEDNVMEEQTSSVAPIEEEERAPVEEKDSATPKKSTVLPSMSQVDMEEVYDYEHDDTREEGELSANEAMSPIHEVFKKLPAEERKRSWGVCSIHNFVRNTIIANEQILKERQIVKRVINKDDFETSESEDLIFVKEIREENIVHDIESEPGNNTSFAEKDNEDEQDDGSQLDHRRRRVLESDRVIDKSSKRPSREARMVISGEGKTVLYIRNLVRPFTVTQLRELLQRTGRIVENGFWIDSIKSKCYVQFENSDQAIETRHALHGIRWPVNNPKVLSVHFATPEELVAAQTQVNETESQRKEPLTVSNHNNDSSQKHIDWKKHFEQYDERPRKVKDVREWDIGKPAHPDEMIWAEDGDYNKKKEDPKMMERSRRDMKRRSDLSDDEPRSKRHKRTTSDPQPPPVEAKLLDDLFKRTKASPSIYWLPLSEEQIAVKQEARRKHLEDISKQLKDRSGDREPRRRDRERRRSRR